MGDANNNQNTDFNPENDSSANTAGQSADYNNWQYYNNQQTADNGQYYNQDTSGSNGQYYNPNGDYGNGQYYNQNSNGSDGRYYNPNGDYGNGQYYNQNSDYSNGQYYNQNGVNNNWQYYNPNNGCNNGQYYDPNSGYHNGQYSNYDQQQTYNNGQYGGYNQQQAYSNGQYNGGGQQYYGQSYPYPYAQPPFMPAEPVREPVTNVFYYILMALTAVSLIITLFEARNLVAAMLSSVDFDTVAGQDMSSLYSSMMGMYASGGYTTYALLNYLLSFAILAFSIVDIVVCHKKGYPIVGLILFTILFKPGYFLWRAHVVKQKKTIPVLFTVGYVVSYFAYFIWTFSYMMSLVV